VKVGLVLPFSGDASATVALAARTQALGFDGVFATDHLFVPGRPERPTLEPFTLLSAVAATCPGLRVGTLVARVTLRHAGMLAKLAASLDDLSGGRAIVGLGSGDAMDSPENEAFGFPAELGTDARRRMLAETADALKALFGGRPWGGGDAVPAIAGPLAPAPRRSGGPPVWLGGASEAVVRLAAEHADGWNGWGLSLEDFAARSALLAGSSAEPTWAGIVTLGDDRDDTLRRVAERRERGLAEAWSGELDDLRDLMRALAEVGATWAIFRLPSDRAEVLATLLPEVQGWA
jgi:alkanesulfonate monooxygenase SsuD/methylene tetrahydromethanopterin reductase-like flavin-dependent oxidoreductase (luciferase family)